MPDHLHVVWELSHGDYRYSVRWQKIKEIFTRQFVERGGKDLPVTASRFQKEERGIWHRRFWEHTCMDEDDLKQCVDYLHWNPVKHGLVRRVADYPWSSFHRFVRLGEYPIDWGASNPCPDFEMPE
jgi:putative transposase